MDLRSSVRSSRSRSKTPGPLTSSSIEQEFVKENSIQQYITRSTRRTTAIFKAGNGSSVDKLSEEYNTKVELEKPSTFKRLTRSVKFNRTSDYSSEEDESKVSSSSTRSMDEYQKNRILEDAQRMGEETSEITALGLYRRAESYWDEYPKTDWTYSPFSKDRVEIAPGEIAMPNMSRRHISSYCKSTNTQSTLTSERTARTRKFTYEAYLLFINVAYILWRPISSLYTFSNTVFITIAKSIYRMTCRVMLMDTWLLRSRRSGRRTVSLIALCLVPLILFAGWWIISNSSDVNESLSTISKIPTSDEQITSNVIDSTAKNTFDSEFDSQKIAMSLTNEQLEMIAKYVNLKPKIVEQKIDHDEIVNKIMKPEIIQNIFNEFNTNYRIFHVQNELREIVERQEIAIQKLIEELDNIKKQTNPELNDEKLSLQMNKINAEITQSLYMAKSELELKFSNLTQVLETRFEELLSKSSKPIPESQSVENVNGNLDLKIEGIVKEMLKIYDADKTGLVDYAMEPMGGEVITTRCTESYSVGRPVFYVLGLPLWYHMNPPRVVITPGIVPGKCWAFQSFPGLLVIKLTAPVKIEAFSMEHISKLLVPDGDISSAPRDFQVFGLRNEEDKNGFIIGEYKYEYEGDPLQFFIAQKSDLVFEYIELRISSNHGNPNYTCLYRFRVHGKRVSV